MGMNSAPKFRPTMATLILRLLAMREAPRRLRDWEQDSPAGERTQGAGCGVYESRCQTGTWPIAYGNSAWYISAAVRNRLRGRRWIALWTRSARLGEIQGQRLRSGTGAYSRAVT